MSAKLPTLYVEPWDWPGENYGGRVNLGSAFSAPEPITGLGVPYVPASALDAALNAARATAQRHCGGCWKDKESKKHGHHDFCEARTILTAFGLDAGPKSVVAPPGGGR